MNNFPYIANDIVEYVCEAIKQNIESFNFISNQTIYHERNNINIALLIDESKFIMYCIANKCTLDNFIIEEIELFLTDHLFYNLTIKYV